VTVELRGDALLEAAFDHVYNAVVITDADFAGGGPFIRRCNRAFCDMTGYSPDEVLGQTPKILQGPETDRKVIDRLRRCITSGEYFEGSTTNYRKDGTPYVVQWNISPVRDDDGSIVAFISIQQDVTARYAAERERALLAQALNAATDPIVVIDHSFAIAFANEAFAEEMGQPVNRLVGHSAFMLNPQTDDGPAEPVIRQTLAEGRPYRGVVSVSRPGREAVYVDLSVAALVGAPGLDTYYVAIAPDVTHLVMHQRALEEMANTDALTGLTNRRAGQVALDVRQREAVATGRPLSLVMADIDHFKAVNDLHGHEVGDDVLRSVATLMVDNLRSQDTAIRWGGEEFLIVLPDTHVDDATVLAERIRRAIAATEFPGVGAVTVSFGVGQWRATESQRHLLARVDTALYEAKDAGRNCVARAN
jgi:diguanylate cyclase (GGDEF)-like protein/PAS domain S-box-containing protein